MKKTRFIALTLTLLLLLPTLCFCTPEQPENGTDGSSDGQTTAVDQDHDPKPEPLTVVDAEKKTGYTIVRPDDATEVVASAASALYKSLTGLGVTGLNISNDHPTMPQSECEILVASLGRELPGGVPTPELNDAGDYIIKVYGKRILIYAHEQMISEACDKFLSLWDKEGAFTVDGDYSYVHKESKMSTELKINVVSAENYTVFAPAGDYIVEQAAKTLVKELYDLFGVILPVSEQKPEGAYISLSVEGDSGPFKLSVAEDGCVNVTSSRRIGLSRGIRDFVEITLAASPSLLVSGYSYENGYGEFVTYEDFGAKGDGVTDDQAAIVLAHADANAKGLPVLAREDAIYYIGGGANTAMIETDTDWSVARFIYDDTSVENIWSEIFRIPGKTVDIPELSSLKSLKAGATNIGIKLPCSAMLILRNDTVRQFIRKGSNQDSGNPMQDLILVDKDGNIDPSTPVLWDFDTITAASAVSVEDKPLVLRGGIITTRANSVAAADYKGYYYRGIRVYRSNTVIDGLVHYVENEGASGSPYYGVIIVNSVYGFTMRNCVLTGHKTYKSPEGVSRGTYDVTFDTSTHIRVENCTQTNDITNTKYWGVFASNCCKNIELEGCTFSRFDAHRGVCNVSIKSSVLGHQGINLIGHGEALIEDTIVYAKQLVNLRSDYGSTFNGNLTVRDCRFYPTNDGASVTLINGSNSADWYFGYTCHLPTNITIDGLYIGSDKAKVVYIFSNITQGWTNDAFNAQYKPVITEKISVKGISLRGSFKLAISSNNTMFKTTQLIAE